MSLFFIQINPSNEDTKQHAVCLNGMTAPTDPAVDISIDLLFEADHKWSFKVRQGLAQH